MKQSLALAFITFLLAVPSAQAQDRGLGLGLVIGSPTGFSAKYWVGREDAMQFGVGWVALRKEQGTAVSFDYLWHSMHAIRSSERLPLFYGLGAQIVESSVGVRGVGGIAWLSRKAPVDVFLQVVPILQFNENSGFYLDAAIGVRYFF